MPVWTGDVSIKQHCSMDKLSLSLLKRSPKFNSNQYFTEHLLWAKHCAAVSTKVNEIHIVLTKGGKQGKGWACRDGGGMNWEIGIDVYTLIYVKYITNKNLLCNK